MRVALRTGAAIFNDGHYHAAHDAWEDQWLELESGTDDELLLHGLIQYTAAVYHATEHNWEGAVGLARSAHEYLEPLSHSSRGVDLGAVRPYLVTLATDPAVIERQTPVPISVDGTTPTLADLSPEEITVAAVVLAEECGFDEAIVERAGAIALEDLAAGRDDSEFIALVYDFVTRATDRALVFDRLRAHLERREHEVGDVEGLFEE